MQMDNKNTMEMEQKLREEGIVANKDKDVWKD